MAGSVPKDTSLVLFSSLYMNAKLGQDDEITYGSKYDSWIL